MVKSTLLLAALAAIASAVVYDDTVYQPVDCTSSLSMASCMKQATSTSCSLSDEKCDCHDYLVEEDCLNSWCKGTTETSDNYYFNSCAHFRTKGFSYSDYTPSPTQPNFNDAKETGKSESTASVTAASSSSATSTSTSTSTNAAYAAGAPVGGVLGLMGIALGAFL